MGQFSRALSDLGRRPGDQVKNGTGRDRRQRIRRYRGAASGLRQGGAAIVVPELAATVDNTSVVTALADKLPKFDQPKAVIMAGQLPRNTVGKAQKSLLRESHAHLSSD